jgi:DNA-binding NarL/FixJ family response regulator
MENQAVKPPMILILESDPLLLTGMAAILDVLAAASGASELRNTTKSKETPVLFLADRLEANWIEPLNLAGGVYCLPKPFEPEVLLDLVEKAFCLPHLAVAKVAPPKPHYSNEWVRLT